MKVGKIYPGNFIGIERNEKGVTLLYPTHPTRIRVRVRIRTRIRARIRVMIRVRDDRVRVCA